MSNEEKLENEQAAAPSEAPETTDTADNADVAPDATAEAAQPDAAASENAPVNDASVSKTAEPNDAVTENADGAAPADESVAEDKAEDKPVVSEKQSDVEVDRKDRKDGKDKKTVKAKKPARKSSPQGSGMSSLFKLIYYPVLAFVVVIMLVFSAIDGVYGYKPDAYDADFYSATKSHIAKIMEQSRSELSEQGLTSVRDTIEKTLISGGFTRATEVKAGEDKDDEPITTVTDWATKGGVKTPTVTRMTSVLSSEIQTEHGLSEYLIGKELTNIIAAIPADKTRNGETADSVIITVNYDTRTDSSEAANASFAATLLQSLVEYSEASLQNDLVVVFTEDIGKAYGSYAFFDSFKGLGDAVARAKAGLDLRAYGTGGTLALTDASHAGLDYLNAYTSISGTAFNASFVPDTLPDGVKNTDSVAAFGAIPVVQVGVIGGLNNAQSPYDTGAADDDIIYQQAALIKNYIEKFTADGRTYSQADADNVFFSYFDWGTVAYTRIAAYVIGAIILALIAAIIVMSVIKKTFPIVRMLKALGVQVLVLVGSLAAMYAAYFLITLMLTGFGVLPIHAITQVRYFNAGILIAAMLVALAAAFGFTTLFKKLFKVTSSDVVRGNALLFATVGAILSFAAPAYSYIVSWLGLLLGAVLLVTILLNGKLKDRFGFGFDRLFIYAVPVAICMPVVMSGITGLMALTRLVILPIIMLLFVGMLGVAVPYLDRSAVVFDKIAKKLPARTVRIERTVTEKVEDRAKKGKFTERTVKRVDKEKVPVNYKNYFGISLVAVLGVVVALFSGGFGASFGKSVTDMYSYNNAIYNDAIVYEWSMTGSTVKQKVVVDDLIAYKYIRYAVSGLEWDAVNEQYYKTVNYNAGDIIPNTPNITRSDDNVYTVSTFDGPRSKVTLTIPSAQRITKVTLTVLGESGISYEYKFNEADRIVLSLPYGFGNFSLKFEGANPSSIDYEEYSTVMAGSSNNPLANVDEWNMILQYYSGSDVETNLRGGIVLKRTVSF